MVSLLLRNVDKALPARRQARAAEPRLSGSGHGTDPDIPPCGASPQGPLPDFAGGR
jgi:hypothetical protein